MLEASAALRHTILLKTAGPPVRLHALVIVVDGVSFIHSFRARHADARACANPLQLEQHLAELLRLSHGRESCENVVVALVRKDTTNRNFQIDFFNPTIRVDRLQRDERLGKVL